MKEINNVEKVVITPINPKWSIHVDESGKITPVEFIEIYTKDGIIFKVTGCSECTDLFIEEKNEK